MKGAQRMASELTRYGREVEHVFDLLGRREPDLTAALGWTLARAPSLMGTLLHHLGINAAPDEFAVSLEEQADGQGRTDIELTGPGIKVIIEAKQGWLVPDEQQFSLYAPRFEGFEHALFVSLSDSSNRWATRLLRPIGGVPVVHVSWDTVRDALKTTISRGRGREQFWLQQLEGYMGQATSRRPLDDQWVFCVVASDANFGGTTFQDWVRKERVYFHPYGGHNTWPKRPPNFLCFRWGGRVQQVNRVKDFEVVSRLDQRWPTIDDADTAMTPSRPVEEPHIIYDLGPDIPLPLSPISTKGTYATGRVWCLLDQLLTQPTLRDAVRASDDLTKNT